MRILDFVRNPVGMIVIGVVVSVVVVGVLVVSVYRYATEKSDKRHLAKQQSIEEMCAELENENVREKQKNNAAKQDVAALIEESQQLTNQLRAYNVHFQYEKQDNQELQMQVNEQKNEITTLQQENSFLQQQAIQRDRPDMGNRNTLNNNSINDREESSESDTENDFHPFRFGH